MKPLKKLTPYSLWLLRFFFLIVVYIYFIPQITTFSFDGLYYFVALIYAHFAVFLFFSGFSKKPSTSVYSSIVLFLLSVYQCVLLFDIKNITSEWIVFFASAATSLLFMSIGIGNKK